MEKNFYVNFFMDQKEKLEMKEKNEEFLMMIFLLLIDF